MPYGWPEDPECTRLARAVEAQWGRTCGGARTLGDQRHHRVCTLHGPLPLVGTRAPCPTRAGPAPPRTISPAAEPVVAMPWGGRGGEGGCGLGQRRLARHWSVGPSRAALVDTDQMRRAADALATSMRRSQPRLAARRPAPAPWAPAYAEGEAVRRALDGLHPEQGPETLDVVRALERHRVWLAAPLLSRATTAVQQVLGQARGGPARWGKRGRRGMSDQPGPNIEKLPYGAI